MIAVDSTQKINAAIHDCLELCYGSPTPVLCLTEFLKRLSMSREWTAIEVVEVRSRVVRILRTVAAGDEDDGVPIGFSM